MALFTVDQLELVEGYLANDQVYEVMPALEELVGSMETYIDEQCRAGDDVQFFSFASDFQKLAYRRVEGDPRTLVDVPAPFDRAYADYAFALAKNNDGEAAAEALKQAVRWNPMDCAHRLDLAQVLLNVGDADESLKMSFSVFARAASSTHLVRAYLDFAAYFEQTGETDTAAACVKCALRQSPDDPAAAAAAERLAVEDQNNPAFQDDALTAHLLDEQGIPQGANVEVVLSALTLAQIYSERGRTEEAANMTRVAVDLVGQDQARALAAAVRASAAD